MKKIIILSSLLFCCSSYLHDVETTTQRHEREMIQTQNNWEICYYSLRSARCGTNLDELDTITSCMNDLREEYNRLPYNRRERFMLSNGCELSTW